MTNRRVFLFGLDGATFTLLRPWVEEGHLPTFARLMAGGTWGPLASTVPALTPIAWNSMVTGVYPGKHGVFGFVKRKPGSYELDIITSRDRRRPAIWNLLDQAGLRSIVVDVPLTYPPEPINGIMVSGLGTPDVAAEFVHPRPLREVILREFGPYPLDVYPRGDVLTLLGDARRLTDHRLALTGFLMREFPWEFFMLGLMTTDRLQHAVWKFVDPRHPLYCVEEGRRYGPAILDYYRRLDEVTADLLAQLDADTAFLIASDHGFGPLERSVSIPRWLHQSGLLSLGSRSWAYMPPDHAPEFTVRGSGRATQRPVDGATAPQAGGLLLEVDGPDAYAGAVFRVTDLDPHRRYELKAVVADGTPGALLEFDDLTRDGHPIIGGGSVQRIPSEIAAVFQPQTRDLDLLVCMTTYGSHPAGHLVVSAVTLAAREDWSRTTAYMPDVGKAKEGRSIRLNVRGREPQGIVAPGEEYVQTRTRIASGILALRDEDGRPLVTRVHTSDELYRGPYAGEGPDLVVDFAEGVAGPSADFNLTAMRPDDPVCVRVTEGNSGNHRPDGIFMAYGEGIAAGKTIAAHIVDVCPTVLQLLGVPGPADTDGRVLAEMLVSGAGARAAAPPLAGREGSGVAVEAPGTYTDDERRQIEDRLRALGYIE